MKRKAEVIKITIRIAFTVCCSVLAFSVNAQGEGLSPLNAEPRQAQAPQFRSAAGEVFNYIYESQELPLHDDFSINRTRWQGAQFGDADVSYDTTLHKLYIGPDAPEILNVMLDTTWYYTITIQTNPDTVIIDTAANPLTTVRVYDICGENTSAFADTSTWPPYDIRDTVGGGSDTTFFSPFDLVQDSVRVYNVAADQGTYMMGLNTTPLILWQEDDVLVNGTYPIDPPTVGVATFDGLARDGLPYSVDANAWGIADHLTSVPINLDYQPGDSVYLSFFYQTIGLSGDDLVQAQDSFSLEFWSVDDEEWDRVWSTPYLAQGDFEQVMLPITNTRYLKDGFQFRFLNYATLSGSLDHWHLDYVRLAENRSYDDTVIVDVAYLYEESTLLEPYTAVPWTHFEPNPESFMTTSKLIDQKNLDINDRFVEFGMQALYEDVVTDNFINGINSSGNASSTFATGHTINAAPNNFVYDTALADTCAYFDVEFFTNATPDINRYNDTIRFEQNFTTYYAYDDGSAEAAYWLNVAGAKLAYQFDINGGDSLRAVRMYFNPVFEDPSGGSFLVTIWSNLSPENIIHQNFSFSSPEYHGWGPNTFIEYPLDSVIWVENTFYVGWVQTTADKMNIGFDRNNNNGDKIYFNTSNQFFPTSFEGSLMMRPVFVSEKEDPWLGTEENSITQLELDLYPNPSDGIVRLGLEGLSGPIEVQLLDLQGRLVASFMSLDGVLDLSNMSEGLYLLRVTDQRSGASGVQRLVLQF